MHYQQNKIYSMIALSVTGASDGIGREAAMTYARYGATVILLGRNEEKITSGSQPHKRRNWTSATVVYSRFANLRPKIANNWHSALPLIIRVWMVFCIMPDCSAMFAQ